MDHSSDYYISTNKAMTRTREHMVDKLLADFLPPDTGNRMEQIGLADLPVSIPTSYLTTTDTFDWQADVIISQIQLSSEKSSIVSSIVKDVEEVAKKGFRQPKVKIFGSVGTNLSFDNSDLDLFLESTKTNSNFVKKMNRLIREYKPEIKISCYLSKARVPIIKFWHKGWNCDLNSVSMMGVYNSSFIKLISSLDRRIRNLLLLLKYWAKVCKICGGPQQFSSYSLIMVVFFYLQQGESPLLPPFNILKDLVTHNESGELEWKPNQEFHQEFFSKEQIPLKDLFTGFFIYYSSFNFDNAICPLSGLSIPRKDIQDSQSAAVVLDPFERINITKNVTKETVNLFIKGCAMCADAIGAVDDQSMLKSVLSIQIHEEISIFTFKSKPTPKETGDASNFDQYRLLKKAILSVIECLLLAGDVKLCPSVGLTSEHETYSVSKIPDGIWKNRKTTSKNIQCLLPPGFNREQVISRNVEVIKDSFISLKLKVKSFEDFKSNGNVMTVQISNAIESERGRFRDLVGYMKQTLQVWVNDIM